MWFLVSPVSHSAKCQGHCYLTNQKTWQSLLLPSILFPDIASDSWVPVCLSDSLTSLVLNRCYSKIFFRIFFYLCKCTKSHICSYSLLSPDANRMFCVFKKSNAVYFLSLVLIIHIGFIVTFIPVYILITPVLINYLFLFSYHFCWSLSRNIMWRIITGATVLVTF